MHYLLLGAAGLALLAVSWGRRLTPVKVGLFLVSGAIIIFADFLVTGVFVVYQYAPGLLPNQISDARLGVLIAECLFVPALISSVVGSVSRYRVWVSVSLTIPLFVIEWLFTEAGVFLPDGWSIWHSVLLFPPYLAALAVWADHFEQVGYTRIHRLIVVWMTVDFVWDVAAITTNGILGLFYGGYGLMAEPLQDNVLGNFLVHGLAWMFLGILWVWNGWARSSVLLAGFVCVYGLWLWGWEAAGFLHFAPVWSPAAEAVHAAVWIWGTGKVDAWFQRVAGHEKTGALV